MALITCPECQAEKISSLAKACPKCGFPIHDFLEKEKLETPPSSGRRESPFASAQKYEFELRQSSSTWNHDPWIPLKVYRKGALLVPLYSYKPETDSSRSFRYKGTLLGQTFIIKGNGFTRSVTFTEEFLLNNSWFYKTFEEYRVTLDLEKGSEPEFLPLTQEEISNAVDFKKIRSDLSNPCINTSYLSIILDILRVHGTRDDIDLLSKFSYRYPHNVTCIQTLCAKCGYVTAGVKKHVMEFQAVEDAQEHARRLEAEKAGHPIMASFKHETTVERIFRELCESIKE